MRLTKFERRKQEMLKKHQEELAALMEAEQKEFEKLVDPVVEKIAKVAEEEARKILSKEPDILEVYSFKKREAAKALAEALGALFQSETSEDDEDEAGEENLSPEPATFQESEIGGSPAGSF